MTIVRDYGSWAEYRAELAKLDPGADIAGGGGRDWTGGCADVGEALAIADTGWPEGMEYVRNVSMPAIREIAGELEERALGFDVTGAGFDVGEYLNGTPECWISPLCQETKPCITIAANIVSSGGIPAEYLKRRGAAIVALTLALQQSGYAIRVYAVEGMHPGRGPDVWHRVCLTDDSGGPLDTDRLLFALAHPAAARQLGYALGCKLNGTSPYGAPIGWASADKSGRGVHGPEGWQADFELDSPHYGDADWSSDAAVTAWVKHAYESITGRSQNV
jgi:hypothetical protein